MKSLVLSILALVSFSSSVEAISMNPMQMLGGLRSMLAGKQEVNNAIVCALVLYVVASQCPEVHDMLSNLPLVGRVIKRNVPCCSCDARSAMPCDEEEAKCCPK